MEENIKFHLIPETTFIPLNLLFNETLIDPVVMAKELRAKGNGLMFELSVDGRSVRRRRERETAGDGLSLFLEAADPETLIGAIDKEEDAATDDVKIHYLNSSTGQLLSDRPTQQQGKHARMPCFIDFKSNEVAECSLVSLTAIQNENNDISVMTKGEWICKSQEYLLHLLERRERRQEELNASHGTKLIVREEGILVKLHCQALSALSYEVASKALKYLFDLLAPKAVAYIDCTTLNDNLAYLRFKTPISAENACLYLRNFGIVINSKDGTFDLNPYIFQRNNQSSPFFGSFLVEMYVLQGRGEAEYWEYLENEKNSKALLAEPVVQEDLPNLEEVEEEEEETQVAPETAPKKRKKRGSVHLKFDNSSSESESEKEEIEEEIVTVAPISSAVEGKVVKNRKRNRKKLKQ